MEFTVKKPRINNGGSNKIWLVLGLVAIFGISAALVWGLSSLSGDGGGQPGDGEEDSGVVVFDTDFECGEVAVEGEGNEGGEEGEWSEESEWNEESGEGELGEWSGESQGNVGRCFGNFVNIDAVGYENLILNQKSYMVLVDQDACVTSERLKEFINRYVGDSGLKVYRIMYEDMKATSLYDKVNYYPSVAIIKKGKVIGWLDFNSDADTDKFNEYDAFSKWVDGFLGK